MQWLVAGAKPNDSLFFHCKSGVQLKALLFNCPVQTLAMAARSRILTAMNLMDMTKVGTLQSAGLNSSVNTRPPLVIYPVDWKQHPRNQGVIVDDRMHEIMVQSLPAGCRLTVSY
jgi:hypothetical protein